MRGRAEAAHVPPWCWCCRLLRRWRWWCRLLRLAATVRVVVVRLRLVRVRFGGRHGRLGRPQGRPLGRPLSSLERHSQRVLEALRRRAARQVGHSARVILGARRTRDLPRRELAARQPALRERSGRAAHADERVGVGDIRDCAARAERRRECRRDVGAVVSPCEAAARGKHHGGANGQRLDPRRQLVGPLARNLGVEACGARLGDAGGVERGDAHSAREVRGAPVSATRAEQINAVGVQLARAAVRVSHRFEPHVRARVAVRHVYGGGDVKARASAAVLSLKRGRHRHGDIAARVVCPFKLLVRSRWLVVDVQLRHTGDTAERVEGTRTVLPESA